MQRKSRSPVPLYEAIKRHVLDQIDSHRLKSGERIPSEHELTKLFKVSRMTVNRAIRELSVEGRVVRVPGVGSFVATPAQAHPL